MDIRKVRQQTPSCESIIHFNNAGCALMPKSVSDIVLEYLEQEQEYGGYETELERKLELEEFYTSAAGLIDCNSDEIAFCDGNTRGWLLSAAKDYQVFQKSPFMTAKNINVES